MSVVCCPPISAWSVSHPLTPFVPTPFLSSLTRTITPLLLSSMYLLISLRLSCLFPSTRHLDSSPRFIPHLPSSVPPHFSVSTHFVALTSIFRLSFRLYKFSIPFHIFLNHSLLASLNSLFPAHPCHSSVTYLSDSYLFISPSPIILLQSFLSLLDHPSSSPLSLTPFPLILRIPSPSPLSFYFFP